jgi:hypothetical protein
MPVNGCAALKDNVIKVFREVEGSAIDEERYRALKVGDRILVQLDGEQPEVRKFTGFGVRSLLKATRYMGHDYSYRRKSSPKSTD